MLFAIFIKILCKPLKNTLQFSKRYFTIFLKHRTRIIEITREVTKTGQIIRVNLQNCAIYIGKSKVWNLI